MFSLFWFNAVHNDTVKLITFIFQQQGFVTEGLDRIGDNYPLIRLCNISIEARQSQFLICRCYRAVQRQIIHSGKCHITAGQDGACHLLFYNCSVIILFLFAAHRQRAVAERSEFFRGIDGSKKQGSVLNVRISHAPDMGGLRRNVHRRPVIQDANRIILLAHNTVFSIELQRLSGVNVRVGNIRIGTAHHEALVASQGNRILCQHGAQAENIIIVHILDEHILIGSGFCHIPGQENGQGLIRSTDALFAAGEDQVITYDIGIILGLCIVDSLFGIQTHVARRAVLSGVNRSHVDGRMLPGHIFSASYKDIASRLYIQSTSTAGLYAQRHIAPNFESRQLVTSIPLDSNVCSAHIQELLHVFNAFVSFQILHGNRGGLVVKGTHRSLRRSQSHILTQNIGRPFRLNAAAAIRVHHFIADSIEHHILCPFKGGISCLSYQIRIGDVIRQIRICVGVLGILVRDGIRLQILVCRGITEFRIILISLVVAVTICLQRLPFTLRKIGEALPVGKVRIIRSLLCGETLIILIAAGVIFIQFLTLFRRKVVIVGIFIPVCHVGVIRSLILIVVGLPLGLCFSALVGIISRFHIGLVVVAALLQPRNVGAFIGIVPLRVLFAVDQAGVDPAMYHFVHAIRGLGGRIYGQGVDKAAVCNGQLHIPFPGFDLAHAHITALCRFGQINAVLGAGVDLGTVTIRRINQIRAGDVDGLFCRANAAVLAGQGDAATLYGGTAAGLGNIPRCIQDYIPKIHVVLQRRNAILAL